jgi:hypothetical protein
MDLGRHRCSWNGRGGAHCHRVRAPPGPPGAPGKVFSRDDLVDQAWGGPRHHGRTIDSHVRRIRQKLAAVSADPIETVYGIGYRLREDLAA